MRLKAGRPIFGVEMKIVSDTGAEQPWDGVAFGSLKVRGPWICSSYFKLDSSDAHAEEGWFETGDVATIDAQGYMAITDRTKDVIKSGGEWISSIEVENVATDHPKGGGGRRHRPFPSQVERAAAADRGAQCRRPGPHRGGNAGLVRRQDRQMVDAGGGGFVDELPHTATGKLQKVTLRQMFKDYSFPG